MQTEALKQAKRGKMCRCRERMGRSTRDGFTEGRLCVRDVEHSQGNNWDQGTAQKVQRQKDKGEFDTSVVGIVSPQVDWRWVRGQTGVTIL